MLGSRDTGLGEGTPPFDGGAERVCGDLAAIARFRGMAVATRNVGDFGDTAIEAAGRRTVA